MTRLRPGWLVVACATMLSVSAWLPWLTSGDRHANALGGVVGQPALVEPGFGVGQSIVLLASVLLVAGAMIGRGLSPKLASVVALVISLLIVALMVWFYRLYAAPSVGAGWGLYLAAVSVAAAVGCSVWALVSTLAR